MTVKGSGILEGIVFSVEEFSVYDGPGIRTTVFLKGCPLRCSWCHSPEGQEKAPQIVKSPNGCLGCGTCLKYAEKSGDGFRFTQKSIAHCPRHLLRVAGKIQTPEALTAELLKNREILKNGGVTFSGGEPLLQPEFLLACLGLLKGKIHTALQTCGYVSPEVFRKVLEEVDYVLFDLKLFDGTAHRRYTGVSNENILQNFVTLVRSGKEFVPRIPLIPGVTDTAENIAALANFLAENRVFYAELMPYNTMAGSKYALAGREYKPDFDDKIPCNPRTEIFEEYGIKTLIL